MLREIVCKECQEVIRQDKLFVHLVTQHNWELVPQERVSIRKLKQQVRGEQRTAAPKLGTKKTSISSTASAFIPKVCEFCNRLVDPTQLDKHLAECEKCQKDNALAKKADGVLPVENDRVSCPHCGTDVGKKKLNRHIKNIHPELASISLKETAPAPRPLPDQCICPYCMVSVGKKKYQAHVEKRCPKRSMRTSSVKLPNTCHDPEIAAYLARTAVPEEVGKFGKPQAKIRSGTYSLSNIESDARATTFSQRHPQASLTKGMTAGIELSMELHKANLVTGSEGRLALKARRGAMLKNAAYCSVCRTSAAPLYRYADSNYGPVILCSACKTPVFEHSFGHADAMSLAVDHAHAHKGKW